LTAIRSAARAITRAAEPNMNPATPQYSVSEEIANSLTHGVGVVASIVGLAVLCSYAALHGETIHVVAAAIFGAALILCYTSSTLYHAIPLAGAKPWLRAIDHAAIFVLIAGTYTPFMLVSLGGPWGWGMLAAIWSLAVVGIVLRLVLRGRRHGFVVSLYVAMGWAALIALQPLIETVAPNGLLLLLAGGLAYTGGVLFYRWQRLPYHHAIWHGFVLLGSTAHFFAVLLYVLPDAA